MLFWFMKFRKQLTTCILLLVGEDGNGFSPQSVNESEARANLEMCLMISCDKLEVWKFFSENHRAKQHCTLSPAIIK